MAFDLADWLKAQVGDNNLDCAVIELVDLDFSDRREFLVTNGTGLIRFGEHPRCKHQALSWFIGRLVRAACAPHCHVFQNR